MITISFDYTLSAETEFRNWLDTEVPIRVRTCKHSYIRLDCAVCVTYLESIRAPKTLDERLEEKEKRIKRKIESRLRTQKKRTQKLRDSQLSMGEIDECLMKRLK